MLYMKEMRAKVVAECTLKESAAINQILGRRVSSRRCASVGLGLRWWPSVRSRRDPGTQGGVHGGVLVLG